MLKKRLVATKQNLLSDDLVSNKKSIITKPSVLSLDLSEIDHSLEDERVRARELADTATDLMRRYNKEYRDAHSRKPSVYEKGDYMLIRDTWIKPGKNAKIKSKYKGPYVVYESLGNNRS